ncbi:MAG: lytic transglycosylase domain-containing protein [Gammaproteobacteria bacterium]|nr:lytic transglycosylase domain-containing protein [Gammaproteobacteria bacterium]
MHFLTSLFFAASLVWALALAFAIPAAHAGDTYIYQEKDGTRWLTDRPLNHADYTYIDRYGRVTALSSCKGVNADIMEQRASKHMALVEQFASDQQVDSLMIKAIISAESCFDSRAISRTDARGLMQLMPATARQYQVIDRFDPEQNIRAGVQHFSELLVRFKQNARLAVAAYNAGAMAVDKYGGIPPYRETQTYVTRVFNYYQRYQQQNNQQAAR